MHIKKAAEYLSAVFFNQSQCLRLINLYPEAFRFSFTICENLVESIEPAR